MSEKINIYTLYRKVEQLESVIVNMIARQHKYYDPRDFIKNYNGAIPIYKYKGVYYRSIGDLTKHTSFSADKRTIAAMFDNPARIWETWALGIQLEYIKPTTIANRYICTSGEILMANLVPMSFNWTTPNIKIISEGESIKISRAELMYFYFVSEDIKDTFFIDGVYGNCRIDNVVPYDTSIDIKHEA